MQNKFPLDHAAVARDREPSRSASIGLYVEAGLIVGLMLFGAYSAL
ncbi:hypothetical protein [Hephaestia caeni]|nr:hypothetical protein [Hephaestia caeni]